MFDIVISGTLKNVRECMSYDIKFCTLSVTKIPVPVIYNDQKVNMK